MTQRHESLYDMIAQDSEKAVLSPHRNRGGVKAKESTYVPLALA